MKLRRIVPCILALCACESDPPSAPVATTTAKEAAPPASASAITEPQVAPPNLPGRTEIPPLAEWKKVSEALVKGSSALRCETKMIREWLSVWCHGKNDTGGVPQSVKILEGGVPGTSHNAMGGIVSLLTPYEAGMHIEAVFSWTDKSHKLVLDWPKGMPRPKILGTFEGARSPLSHIKTDDKYRDYACKCAKTTTIYGVVLDPDAIKCDEIVYNVDCARTYSKDCNKYAKCSLGEPGVAPTCLPFWQLIWPNTCAKSCKSDIDCGGDAPPKCGVVSIGGKKQVCVH